MITSTDRRGAQIFGVDLGTALLTLGPEVETVALAEGTAGGLDVPALGTGRPLTPATVAALRRRARDASVVVAHGSSALPACALATVGGPPFVYRTIGDPRYWSPRGLRRARVGWMLRRAAAVVVLWPAAGEELVRHYGVAAARVSVVPNGVPAERFPAADAAARDRARTTLPGVDGTPVVAYLGSLTAEKAPELAVAAVAALPGATLLVAGEGPERPKLEAAAASAAPGRVHFLGSVPDPARVLAAADVILVPSHTEGIPAVAIEAGLTGRPVVATDVGGMREVVVPGRTGVLVPRPEAQALAAGVAEAARNGAELGLAARNHCLERFEITPVARSWSEVLGRIG